MTKLSIDLDGATWVGDVSPGDEVEVAFCASAPRRASGRVDDRLAVVIDVSDDDPTAGVYLSAGGRTLFLPADAVTLVGDTYRVDGSSAVEVPETFGRLLVSGAMLVGALPISQAPHASSFRTRQRAESVSESASSPPSAVPGWTPPLPPNTVGTRYTSTFLAPDRTLDPSRAAAGELLEYETHWEPLGWAFDEWIDSVSLGPYEDTALSSADVQSTGRATSESNQESIDRAMAQATSRASTEEIMTQASNATATSRGVQVGLGGTNTREAGFTIDPIISLTRAVTGSFQLGFSAGRSNSNATVAADLNRRLTSGIEQASTQARHAQAVSLATADHSVRDARRVRALRNLPGDTTANLALFSVVRLWLVRTVLARSRPIILVPIDQQQDEFVERDVFTHRQVLRGALLDQGLVDDLDSVAAGYEVPHIPRPSDDDQQVSGLGVSYRVTDRSGRNARVELQIPVAGDEKAAVASFQLDVAERDKWVNATLPVSCTLRQLSKITLRMDGRPLTDTRVELTDFSVVAQLADGTVELLRDPNVVLGRGQPRQFELARVQLVTARDTSRTRRVLAHLNANRLYYRLAIDLQRDSVSRFQSMVDRHVDPVPIDMNPVGVAGVHLAFLAGDDAKPDSADDSAVDNHDDKTLTSSSDEAQRVIATLVATPEGGTFVELLAGREKSAAAQDGVKRPEVVVPKESALQWPAVTLPTPLAASAPAATTTPATAATPPTTGAPETDPGKIKALLDEMKTMLKATQDQVAKLVDANKPVAPAPPATDPEESPEGE